MTGSLELHEKLNTIKDRTDLADFVDALIADYENDLAGWENADLQSFLQAISEWIRSMDCAYKNVGKEFPANPTWDMFARILYAGKIYE